MKNNKYISEDQFNALKNKKILLKKRKKIFLEDSRYYVEEVRKDIIKKLSYEKVYKEGLNIKTPLNLEYQEKYFYVIWTQQLLKTKLWMI